MESHSRRVRRGWECGSRTRSIPSEIAYDYYTTERTLEAIGHRPAFGLNWGSRPFRLAGTGSGDVPLGFQGRRIPVDCKDAKLRTGNGRRGVLGSRLAWADPRRGWDFVSTGHGDVRGRTASGC